MRALRALLCAVLLALAGCTSTRYVPVETVRDRYHTLHATDTLLLHDSVVIDRAGDTIRELRWRDRWHKSVVHDTIAACDTIREPYPVEVPAKLTAWEHIKVSLGGWALGLCIILFIVIFLLWRRR